MLLRSQGRDAEARAVIGGLVEGQARAGAEDFDVVVKTLDGLGDNEGASAWRARARARYPKDSRFR
jgi:hypothetical protein